jgi:hypothetical protein
MSVKSRWVAATTLAAVVLAAFFTGRTVEERALEEKMHSKSRGSGPTVATIALPRLSHQQLAVAEVFALPFADFYEALRAAPGDAREKWASELKAMPEGPQRRAAISGFYKLLVQFDPAATVKAIGAIEDVRLQKLALDAAVNAAPGFALPLMAELCLVLQDRIKVKRDHLSDVVLEWSLIDAPAVMRFIDQHKEAFEDLSRGGRLYTADGVLSAWAAVDPAAAKEWIDRNENYEDSSEKYEALVEGWYENDHAAAVAFTLAHAEEPRMSAAIGAIVRWLYLDSKDEATKFIGNLPESKRPEAVKEAFRHIILREEEATGEATMTPRAIASWMVDFPPAYWEGALNGLFSRDETAAADMLAWIQQLPPEVREAAAAEYSGPVKQSPSEKISPILQVADPVLRDQLLRAMIKNQSLEFDDATTAVSTVPLSPEQKQHFLQIIAEVKAEKDQEAAALEERARAENDHGSEK